jgi:tetratricopeptide (TPR) repeat protein
MELTEQDLVLLDGFWANGLTDAEMSAVRKRLETDAEFKAAAEAYQQTAMLLETYRMKVWMDAQIAIEQPITEQITQPNHPETVKIFPLPQWAKVAASVTLIAGAYYFYSTRQPSPVDLFLANSFDPPKPIELTMSPEKLAKEEEYKGLKLYSDKKFAEALPFLERTFLRSNNSDSLKLYYISLCHIAEGKPDTAIAILNIMRNSNKAYKTEWFLALAYLKKKEYEKAEELFEIMAKGGNKEEQENATKGLEAIKSEKAPKK